MFYEEIEEINALKKANFKKWGEKLYCIIQIELYKGKTFADIEIMLNKNGLDFTRKDLYNTIYRYKKNEKLNELVETKIHSISNPIPFKSESKNEDFSTHVNQKSNDSKKEENINSDEIIDFSNMSDEQFRAMLKKAEEESRKKILGE